MNQGDSAPVEDRVRKLAELGFSTRHIARAVGTVSQSTVVRMLKRIEEEKATPGRMEHLIVMAAVAFAVLLGIAFLVLAAAVATIAWR